jgi:nucleoside permease NupC
MIQEEKATEISKNVRYMIYSGILVSLLTAGIGGLFNWSVVNKE